MRTLFQQAGMLGGGNVLDIGFRDLQELQEIASLIGPTGSVLGIDIESQQVKVACQQLANLPASNISAREGSILHIPAEDNWFDFVLCKGVLHEVRQLDQAFVELARVCKPGGHIAIIDFQRFSRLKFELYRLKLRLRRQPCVDIHPGFRRERLLGLLRQQQFEEVSYHQLSDKWRLGTNEVSPFLLKAKYKG
jgi:ubiquinone/menaquinone biosynthesis C-methylase UbiE